MVKTIFDYESSEDEAKVLKKRSYQQLKGVDSYLHKQSSLLEDIEKHCHNKRLKKNIYKMDYLKLIAQNPPAKDQVYNPGVTNASSDYEKLPRFINDPVIDSYFRSNNSLINEVMQNEARSMIRDKGMHPENVFESDFCKT